MSRFLGEGTVQANGQAYRLRFDMSTLAEVEERTGRNPVEILAEMDGAAPSIATLRRLCHAMLLRHHPEASLETAGDILSEDMEGFMAIVQAALPQDGERPSGNGGAKAARRR